MVDATHPTTLMQMAKMPEEVEIGRLGLVAAIVAAFHAATDGALKVQVTADGSRMQG